MEKYSQWLIDRFAEWEKRQGRRQSYSAFARYLGVKQSSLSQWMAGNYPPRGENIIKIADKLGLDIYDALGLPRPAADEARLLEIYRSIAPDDKEGFLDFAERYLIDKGGGTRIG